MNQDRTVRLYVKAKGIEDSGVSKASVAIKGGKPAHALFAVFIVLGLYVRFETSYDRWVPGHENLYMVQGDWNLPGSPFDGMTPQTPTALLEMLRETDPAWQQDARRRRRPNGSQR